MKIRAIVVASGLALATAAAWAASGDGGTGAASTEPRDDLLPMERVVSMIAARQTGRIVEVELEREDGKAVYEIELITPEGGKRKLLVDAATGRVVGQE